MQNHTSYLHYEKPVSKKKLTYKKRSELLTNHLSNKEIWVNEAMVSGPLITDPDILRHGGRAFDSRDGTMNFLVKVICNPLNIMLSSSVSLFHILT